MQAIAADICVESPFPLLEACGTSGQRSARNGGIALGLLGAGPKDWSSEVRTEEGDGALFGPYLKNDAQEVMADREAFYTQGPADILDKLKIRSSLFYENPAGWRSLMLQYYLASAEVTARAMERRYAREAYDRQEYKAELLDAAQNGHSIEEVNSEVARCGGMSEVEKKRIAWSQISAAQGISMGISIAAKNTGVSARGIIAALKKGEIYFARPPNGWKNDFGAAIPSKEREGKYLPLAIIIHGNLE